MKDFNMTDTKPIIVTGGNTGIGKAIALQLAQQQRHVVIVSRNAEKGRQAQEYVMAKSHNERVEWVQGDLGSLQQVEDLAALLMDRYPEANGLINNAGVWMTTCEHNIDGFERTFMVNHLAPFVLTSRLLPTLQNNAPARIVNVNAGLYIKGLFSPEQTPYGKDFHPLRTYAHTKLWNVLFTMEMAQRIHGSGVTINAIHPGVIRTNLGHTTGPMGWLLRGIKLLWGKPEQGADGPVWLATSPEHQATNGVYFDQRKVMPLADNAAIPGRAAECWSITNELVGGLG